MNRNTPAAAIVATGVSLAITLLPSHAQPGQKVAGFIFAWCVYFALVRLMVILYWEPVVLLRWLGRVLRWIGRMLQWWLAQLQEDRSRRTGSGEAISSSAGDVAAGSSLRGPGPPIAVVVSCLLGFGSSWLVARALELGPSLAVSLAVALLGTMMAFVVWEGIADWLQRRPAESSRSDERARREDREASR